MTYALFSLAMAWMLAAIYLGLRAADSCSEKAERRYFRASTYALRAGGIFALLTLVHAFYDAARSL